MKDYKGSGIPQFPANARVCFLGDSLTASGLWTEIIFEEYLKNCPEKNVRIYNCGVGTSTARFAIEHYTEDLLTFSPTHIVIMYAGNDINCYSGTLYEKTQKFYNDMHELCDIILSHGIKIYFMTAPASHSDDDKPTDVRAICYVVLRTLADEYKTECTDLYKMMTPHLDRADMIMDDLVHPNALGEAVMARLFLHSQGFDGYGPDSVDFLSPVVLKGDGDRRFIFDNKLRRIWLTIANISTVGDTIDEKIETLKEKLTTHNEGRWDDFCYYRAMDFIEMRPNMDFYHQELERLTDIMLEKANIK